MSETYDDFNPKQFRNINDVSSFNLPKLKDPISDELNVVDDVIKAFKEFPLIPYASGVSTGVSVSGLLDFFNSMRFISPTQGACHESIKTYVFGGFKVVKLKNVFRENEIIDNEDPLAQQFMDFVESMNFENGIESLSESMYDDFKSNGNLVIELTHTSTLGIKQSSVHYHSITNCAYFATKPGEPQIMVLSPRWDYTYLKENPPKMIALYPNYTVDELGTQRTIIHLKNGNFKYFGRPDWVGSWKYGYREYQDSDYLTKVSANQFTGQVYFEHEEDDIENDEGEDGEGLAESFGKKIERHFSVNAVQPKNVIVGTRPIGAGACFIYEFKPYTNENFYKVSSEISRGKIIENNQWSERLLGLAVGTGFSETVFYQELKIKEGSVLKRYRNILSKALNICIQEGLKFQGISTLKELGIGFTSVFELDDMGIDAKQTLDAFGVGVRGGAITPNKDDETYFRSLLKILPPNAYTDESWTEDGNYRRPITLKGSEDSQSEATRTGGPQPTKSEDPIEE